MSITLLQQPYTDSTYKYALIGDGLPFVATSSNKNRLNYQYIFDVYVGGTLQARLKRNPDIGTKLGVFEAGRILETYVTETLDTLQAATQYPQKVNQHWASMFIKMGEEYSRLGEFTSCFSSGGFARYTIKSGTSHNLRVGDRVFIEAADGTTSSVTTGWQIVTAIYTTSFITSTPFSGNFSGTFREAEGFFDNSFWVDANGEQKVGLVIPKTRPTRIEVGDTVRIVQDSGATNPGYDGEWLVLGVNSLDATYDIIKTNAPWLGSTPVNGGAILSYSNYKNYDVIQSDTIIAINGGSPYGTFFQASDYFPIDSTSRFLTNAPSTQNARLGEFLGLTYISDTVNDLNRWVNYKIWVQPLTHIVSSTGPGEFTILGNFTSYYKVGDFVQLNGTTATITSVVFLLGLTTIQTDQTGLSYNSIYLIWRTLEVLRFGSYKSTPILEAEVGPAQVSLIPNYPIQTAIKWDVWLEDGSENIYSETRTIRVSDDCSNWTPFRIAWINRYGMWDQFTFRGGDVKTTNIDRTQFNRTTKSINSSNQWTYKVGDRGDTQFNIDAQASYSVWSPNLSREELVWLEELWTSPRVYWLRDGEEYPINVTNDSYTLPGTNAPGLKKVNLEFTVAWTETIQRG